MLDARAGYETNRAADWQAAPQAWYAVPRSAPFGTLVRPLGGQAAQVAFVPVAGGFTLPHPALRRTSPSPTPHGQRAGPTRYERFRTSVPQMGNI
jgi:hypothetical protein